MFLHGKSLLVKYYNCKERYQINLSAEKTFGKHLLGFLPAFPKSSNYTYDYQLTNLLTVMQT